MIDIEPLYGTLRSLLVAALPELAAGGIYEAEDADTVPWSDFAVPYAVIVIDEVPRSDFSPLGEEWAQPRVQLYYVAAMAGDSSALRAKLLTVRALFWPGSPGTDPLAAAAVGQVLSEPAWSWSDSLPPNARFRQANVLRSAGRVVLDVLVAGA